MKLTRRLRRAILRSFVFCATMALGIAVARAQSSDQSQPSRPGSPAQPHALNPAPPTSVQPGQPTNEPGAQVNRIGSQGATAHNNTGIHFELQKQGGPAAPGAQAAEGLGIASVDANSPAAQAGLQANDRVLSVDGHAFKNSKHLTAYLSAQVGRPVPFLVERNGQRDMVEIFPLPASDEGAFLGVYLQEEPNPNSPVPAPPGQAQNAPGAQNAPSAKGARVAQVFPTSPAARAGLRSGDLVIQVNGQKVEDPAELITAVHELKPQSKAELVVMRDNQQVTIPVTLGGRNAMAFNGPGEMRNYPEGSGPQFRGYRGSENFPPYMMQLEHDRRIAEQHKRIEDEIRALRDEVKQLRDQLQQQRK